MKYYILLLILILPILSFGQVKDRRAKLEITGRINEISVSPDEQIWLTSAVGTMYFTNTIDTNWHYGDTSFQSDDEFGIGGPFLERISFFNKDTAIMTGYIPANDEKEKNNGYYLTHDGGKTWELLDYGGDSWIYDIYVNEKGKAWMGGSSGKIYFSEDYGQQWKKLKSPYNSSTRMHSIFMSNNLEGISGALHNRIYQTSDNWKTYQKVPTPYDQKKYIKEDDNSYSDDRIEKIRFWKNYIVVDQNGQIFYTDKNNIDWKPFSETIIDFEINKNSQELYAITNDGKVISFTTPATFKPITKQRLTTRPLNIKVVNQSLYIINNKYEVYRVNTNGITHAIPYTTDRKITKPTIVKKFKNLTWGISGNQIYLSEDNGKDWYREDTVKFSVADFQLKNDSLAILWDGHKNNYRYSLNTHKIQLYKPKEPLQKFLNSPIQSVTISASSLGCFHSAQNKVVYIAKDASTLATTKTSESNYTDAKASKFKNEVSLLHITEVLEQINNTPSKIPSIQDFTITDKDVKNYISLVDKRIKEGPDFSRNKKKVNKEFYYNIPNVLDTLNTKVIRNILHQREGIWSTSSNQFTIQITNQNNDVIHISRNYYMNSLPWNLPWKVTYNEQHFNSYDINFSKFIDSCIPKDFMNKDVFDNKHLIMKIADYLYNNKK
ncbi:hypothetical protein [uncultured Dokdonia sp.]|uniref:WD40/YVTN/BNR-like repeat-containing protein n=1 Tax=uncultured Dokdonia sp. TaxID=575653 RepID=UPI00262237B5|nr:hypothetical protein [uncultured Dokdonia sp.]